MNLQNYILLLLGVILSATLVIVIVFIIINVCIKKTAAKYKARSPQSATSYEMATGSHSRVDHDARPPPLPSREQFETESCHSYEDVKTPPRSPKEPVQFSLRHPQTVVNHHESHVVIRDDTSISESYDDVDALEQNDHSFGREVSSGCNLTEPVRSSPLQFQTAVQHVDTQVTFRDDKSVSESYDDVDDIVQNARCGYDDRTSLLEYVELEEGRSSPDSYDDIGELVVESDEYDDLG